MCLSQIVGFACQGSKVTPDNIENLITEKYMHALILFVFPPKFLDLLNFGSETIKICTFFIIFGHYWCY